MRTEISYRIVNSRTEYFTEHDHDFSEIFIMLTGEARHCANGRVEALKPGDIVLIRASDIHKYIKIPGKEFTFCNLTFTNRTINGVFDYLGEGFPSSLLIESKMPPMSSMTKRELASFNEKLTRLGALSPDDSSRIKTALRILLMDILTAHFSDFGGIGENNPTWFDTLCAQMRANGNFAEGAQKMVELSGKSREHLSRCMRKYMGITLSEFINDLRLNYIANMLRNSNKKISDIVFDSGFNTMSLATRLFKQKYGVSMKDFRHSR